MLLKITLNHTILFFRLTLHWLYWVMIAYTFDNNTSTKHQNIFPRHFGGNTGDMKKYSVHFGKCSWLQMALALKNLVTILLRDSDQLQKSTDTEQKWCIVGARKRRCYSRRNACFGGGWRFFNRRQPVWQCRMLIWGCGTTTRSVLGPFYGEPLATATLLVSWSRCRVGSVWKVVFCCETMTDGTVSGTSGIRNSRLVVRWKHFGWKSTGWHYGVSDRQQVEQTGYKGSWPSGSWFQFCERFDVFIGASCRDNIAECRLVDKNHLTVGWYPAADGECGCVNNWSYASQYCHASSIRHDTHRSHLQLHKQTTTLHTACGGDNLIQ